MEFVISYRHQETYLDKLIEAEKLSSQKWKEFIWHYCEKSLERVDFEADRSIMDVRDLIKVRCISQGKQSESSIIQGEVFTNQVVRSDMPKNIANAKLLLGIFFFSKESKIGDKDLFFFQYKIRYHITDRTDLSVLKICI